MIGKHYVQLLEQVERCITSLEEDVAGDTVKMIKERTENLGKRVNYRSRVSFKLKANKQTQKVARINEPMDERVYRGKNVNVTLNNRRSNNNNSNRNNQRYSYYRPQPNANDSRTFYNSNFYYPNRRSNAYYYTGMGYTKNNNNRNSLGYIDDIHYRKGMGNNMYYRKGYNRHNNDFFRNS